MGAGPLPGKGSRKTALAGAAQSGRRGRRRSAPMAEINVTPFVDVMLVLLIIFMVAAPLLTVGVPLQLPQTAAEAVRAEPEEPLTVSIPADGPLVLMTTTVPEDEFVTRLRAVAAERASPRIYLRADGAVAYARVMQVMGALNAAGYHDIVLVTDAGGPTMDAGAPGAAQPAAVPAAQPAAQPAAPSATSPAVQPQPGAPGNG